ncbi:MAG: glycosyltransferase family 2 protein [Methylomicrobium sp.]|nr:glycosyltransferase family 2 protein [Methylomicrobium sp.]
MSNIELTIGIPTYNGAKYLAESIESVLSQLPDVQGRRIEIIISDNASTDDTSEIVERYVATHPGILSNIKNDLNIGYDRNVDNLFKAARGKYLWLLGDDDALVPGALKRFFSALQQYEDIAVFVFSTSFLNISTGKRYWNRQFQEDNFCSNGNDFLQKTLWGTAALSSLCIRRDDWNAEMLDQYFGSQWIHIGGIVEIMRHHKNAYIFADEMVVVRLENPRWNGHFGNQLESSLKYLAMLEATTSLGYSPETFRCFLEARYEDNLMGILFTKPSELKRKIAVAKRMIHFFKTKPGFWLFHLPILFTPNVISDKAVDMAKRLKRIFRKYRPVQASNGGKL